MNKPILYDCYVYWELITWLYYRLYKLLIIQFSRISVGKLCKLGETLSNGLKESVIIIIIIIMCHKQGYPWPSVATSPYRSSPLAGLQGYIPYPHRAAVCMFELVVLLLPGHMWGSIGVHHLWPRPCFSSWVQHVCWSDLDSFRDGSQVAV